MQRSKSCSSARRLNRELTTPPLSSLRPARLAALAVVLAAVTLGTAGPAAASPTVTLLTPSNGSTVTIQPGAYITYHWQVNWPDVPPQGIITTIWELSTDPYFGPGQVVGAEGQTCSAQNYACWTSWAPPRAYGPPYGQTFYWRVTFNGVVSAVSSLRVMLAPDLVKPRARAFSGSARRGTTAQFTAQLEDNRGAVRYRATLEYRGRPILARSFPFLESVWTAPLDFYSSRPLPRRMRPGRYQFCIKAWDRAGNRARSCAPYRIR
ncbi:MAG TPA: hypothetical protein VK488_03665 [Gaiellaceae bacterium]|nr:hypothetical protein [Gaiellaceae bacterium]